MEGANWKKQGGAWMQFSSCGRGSHADTAVDKNLEFVKQFKKQPGKKVISVLYLGHRHAPR